jgi:RNA-directed DNA polymerase
MITAKSPMNEWKNIPWRKIERSVFKLQTRIYQASLKGDRKTVHRLQRLLTKSHGARLLAVRKVTQDNQGKQTAGIDGVKSLSPKQRSILSQTLRVEGKAQPVRRTYIPKPGTTEKRPLGIPTMEDRATQALVKLALEPEWEARFEPNSYGFRPGRSCHDAIAAIFLGVRIQAKWVLDADIAKCFDRINHEQLLNKIQTFPALRRQLRAWLQAGVMDHGELFPTREGTPQGGCISPLLANIALHGLENEVARHFPQRRNKKRKSTFYPPRVVRYADDFVVLHQDRAVIEQCQNIVEQWLRPMGLELKPSKTRITHTLERNEEAPGFDFLGYNIRQHPVGKYRSGRHPAGRKLGFKTVVKPSATAVKQHTQRLRDVLWVHRASAQEKVIKILNPIITGWSRYFSVGSGRPTFSKLSEVLFHMLWGWAIRRHPNENRHRIADKYWRHNDGKGWKFQPRGRPYRLSQHRETRCLIHVKVTGRRSPYDGDWVHWSTRLGRSPTMSKRVAGLLKAQKGKCRWCGLHFRTEDRLEVDHIQPRTQRGSDATANLQLLHRHCHDRKTARDRGAHEKRHVREEPYDGKLSRTVLKPSRGGDAPA